MKNPSKTNTEAKAEIATAYKLFWASVGFYGLEAVFPPPAVSFYPDVQVPLY